MQRIGQETKLLSSIQHYNYEGCIVTVVFVLLGVINRISGFVTVVNDCFVDCLGME